MTEERFLSRVTLRRDAPIAALRSVLLPPSDERRMMVSHQLMWTLFAGAQEQKRDFLWRDAGEGRFYILSSRPPHDAHGLFVVDDPKPFRPALSIGDRLSFILRANATIARRAESQQRGKVEDVVMHAMFGIPSGPERASARASAVVNAGRAWLERQGSRCGFELEAGNEETSVVAGHRALRVEHKGASMTFGVIDYAGTLVVRDPVVFAASLRSGFGRAKAFGCGLMLVRRALE